jgi:hypothetical protein
MMNAGSPPVIETTALVKDFGRTRALDGLDLSVPAGEVHGFLGPQRRFPVKGPRFVPAQRAPGCDNSHGTAMMEQ